MHDAISVESKNEKADKSFNRNSPLSSQQSAESKYRPMISCWRDFKSFFGFRRDRQLKSFLGFFFSLCIHTSDCILTFENSPRRRWPLDPQHSSNSRRFTSLYSLWISAPFKTRSLFLLQKCFIHALIDVIGVEREEKERFNLRQISFGTKALRHFPAQFSLHK